MNNKDFKKIIIHTKEMPDIYKILKNFILDYLSMKEQNEKLIITNLSLLNDIEQYKELVKEQLNTEITIH